MFGITTHDNLQFSLTFAMSSYVAASVDIEALFLK